MKSDIIKILIMITIGVLGGKYLYIDKVLVPKYEEQVEKLDTMKYDIHRWEEIKYKYEKLQTEEELEKKVKKGFGTNVEWNSEVSKMFTKIGFVEESTVLPGEYYNFSKIEGSYGAIKITNNENNSIIEALNQVTITLIIDIEVLNDEINENLIENTIKGIFESETVYNIQSINLIDTELKLELVSFYI